MPTYSYRCTQCDNAFDIQQSFTDDNLTVCPVCGGRLRKVFSPIGVSFTGSGFYRNDSRASTSSSEGAKKSSEKPSSESKPSSDSTSSASSKPSSDSKPAAPSAPASSGSAAPSK